MSRHLLEVAQALLFQMAVPKSYLGEVVLIATYFIIRVSSDILGNVSRVLLDITISFFSYFAEPVFDCVAFFSCS